MQDAYPTLTQLMALFGQGGGISISAHQLREPSGLGLKTNKVDNCVVFISTCKTVNRKGICTATTGNVEDRVESLAQSSG